MLTAIEVIDTAVKVGLGALITATTTYFAGRDKARLDRQNSYHQELRTLLRQIATEIAKADACLEDYFRRGMSATSEDVASPPSEHSSLLAECASITDHAYALAGLSGDRDLRQAVRELMTTASEILGEFASMRATETLEGERYSEQIDQFNAAREAALDALAAAYARTAA